MNRFTFDFETTQESKTHGTVTIHASGSGWYSSATMYSNNGDPGDPSDGEITFDEVECTDEDGNEIEGYEPDYYALEDEAYSRC